MSAPAARLDDAASPPATGRTTTLDALEPRRPARVLRIETPPGAADWGRWLADIGAVPGETVVLLTRAWPGGDPMMVRVGDSSFALRRAEARCVIVEVAG